MKVLEINMEKTWRGGERQTLYTCQGLIAAGCQVDLLCRGGSLLAQKAKAENVPIIELASNYAVLQFLAKKGKLYDIIHAQTAQAQSWALLASAFYKTPIVYTRRVDFKLKGGFSAWKYRRTHKLIAISGAIRQIMEMQGLKNISVIPSLVVKSELDAGRARKATEKVNPDKKKVIGTLAAFVPHKDPLTMVAAIKELRLKRKDFIFLHFGNGELEPQVRQAITEAGLENVYHLMGYVEKVEDFYSIFDVFAMSSQEEGLGSSVLDAFLYKVPVASTNAGGLKETVEGRGLLSPVHNAQALAANINILLDDKALVLELTEKAEREVLENYSLEQSTQKYLEIFRGLLATTD